ncbi:hypothetical protein SUGI_0647790 [Cryptomeria japonica]|uniref:dirigent protein 11-like n=1 Tax=Cryptomeria japonica TaxID=3369 RepID=UPI002414B976|nr:dirigent protein 11-like [Cryptomeria japonica]GLJ32177.1 hypothetical protein SUGI_0647790 [Cryptomeria japonica]
MALKPSLVVLLLNLVPIFLVISGASCKEKNMVFYVQEIVSGANATVLSAGGVNGSSSNVEAFGTVFVIDNAITQGSHPNSKLLGRLQGVEANTDLSGKNYHMVSSLIFENGSSLEIQGTIRTQAAKRELSVVGGTGQFRFAHGFVIVEVVAFDGVNLTFKLSVTVQT